MAHSSLGIIGYGSMGSAIAHGIMGSSTLSGIFSVNVYDISDAVRKQLKTTGATWFASPEELAANSDFILLAVKPYQVESAIKAILPHLDKNKTLLSIAAAQPLSALRRYLKGACAAVQIMPNTPALVNDGVFGLCCDDPILSSENRKTVELLFQELGTVFVLPEDKMNALSAVTGCGPAYVYALMDAVMEASVTLGFSRADATLMVTCLFRGAAKMVEETGLHPAVLHSQVTSPGGMTIAGTNHLSRTAVRGHLIDAVLAAAARGKAMEQE